MNPSRWRLDGQVALVTGASKGIGFACARELAALGADVLAGRARRGRTRTGARRARRRISASANSCRSPPTSPSPSSASKCSTGSPISRSTCRCSSTTPAPTSRKATLDYTEDEIARSDRHQLILRASRCADSRIRISPNTAMRQSSMSARYRASTHVRSGSPYGMTKAAMHAAHAQSRLRMGRRRHPRQRRRAVVHPHAAHGRRSPTPTISTKCSSARRWAASANLRKSPLRWLSCACRRRATSLASVSPSMADFCTTDSEGCGFRGFSVPSGIVSGRIPRVCGFQGESLHFTSPACGRGRAQRG